MVECDNLQEKFPNMISLALYQRTIKPKQFLNSFPKFSFLEVQEKRITPMIMYNIVFILFTG